MSVWCKSKGVQVIDGLKLNDGDKFEAAEDYARQMVREGKAEILGVAEVLNATAPLPPPASSESAIRPAPETSQVPPLLTPRPASQAPQHVTRAVLATNPPVVVQVPPRVTPAVPTINLPTSSKLRR